MPEKTASYDAVCQQLDAVVVQVFATLKELYEQQTILDESLKAGFLNMSRAR